MVRRYFARYPGRFRPHTHVLRRPHIVQVARYGNLGPSARNRALPTSQPARPWPQPSASPESIAQTTGDSTNRSMKMEQPDYLFVDRTGAPADQVKLIPPVVVPKEQIEAEAERLAGLPPPSNGRRVSLIVNPLTGAGNGFAPGTAVSLSVLKPGEQTKPIRHNSSQVNFCIRGGGQSRVDGKCIRFEQYDVWNTPPWAVYEHLNDTNDLQVRLTYSNSALLEKMQVHISEEAPKVAGASG